MEDPFRYDDDYCFRCCAEYGTNEPCPECSCDFLDEFEGDEFWEELEEQEYEAWDDGEFEDWEDEAWGGGEFEDLEDEEEEL